MGATAELSNYEKTIKKMIDSGELKPISQKCWFCGAETFTQTFREYEPNRFNWFAHCEKH